YYSLVFCISREFLKTHKMKMKENVEHIFQGKEAKEEHLKNVFTELFITEGDIEKVNHEHEVLQIDDAFKTCKSQNRSIKCNDVFSLNKNEKKKIVLTKGIAGIGKTVSVHKFILDWAEGKANGNIDCVFLLPFRKINCIKNRAISLHEFLQKFNPEMQDLETTKINKVYKCTLAFIFDGLDESRLSLDFDSGMVTSVEERSSVDELFASLVNRTLLPSALVWVTSRPAAANQIPPEYVGLFTEVRGFTDQQKEEYFSKRFKDTTQTSRMISHIKKSRSLYIMCYIPVFCWITATVLQDIPIGNNAEDINTTLTEMYIHFLLIQMNMKNSNETMILKLAKLAFEQLKKENIVFYEKDLQACDIDVSDFESTGMLTEIFQQEAGLHEVKVFCFVHLSVQEFLAAVHVFLCYLNKNMEDPLHYLLVKAVEKAMQSQRGHLDLFLRFLMGISLESNQNLLRGLFPHTEDSKDSVTKTTEHIRKLLEEYISPETSVNLFYCLLELSDNSLYMEIQSYIKSNTRNDLSSSMCSLLAYVLLMSEEVLDELDLTMYGTLSGDRRTLLPIPDSRLMDLDMSHNELQDSGVKLLSDALKKPDCQLKILRLESCKLTGQSCESVASVLQSSNSRLIELDMSNNELQDSGVKLLSDGLKKPNCQLKILRFEIQMLSLCCYVAVSVLLGIHSSKHLNINGCVIIQLFITLFRLESCKLTGQSCESVASVLQSSNSRLIELDMSHNELQDSGVKLLSDGLKKPNCQLKILRLERCKLTGQSCEFVASALQSSNSRLIDLDMSYNNLRDSGVKLLSDALKKPNCQLEILRFENQMCFM
uniref:NACHT domain-containing protein n=1 Tax=Sinocyclocheilus rhinocerous TaxID=307959 RepID=A0A673M3M8_9TELE